MPIIGATSAMIIWICGYHLAGQITRSSPNSNMSGDSTRRDVAAHAHDEARGDTRRIEAPPECRLEAGAIDVLARCEKYAPASEYTNIHGLCVELTIASRQYETHRANQIFIQLKQACASMLENMKQSNISNAALMETDVRELTEIMDGVVQNSFMNDKKV